MAASPTWSLTKQENSECRRILSPVRDLPATAAMDAIARRVLGLRRASYQGLSRPSSLSGSIASTRTVQFPAGAGRLSLTSTHTAGVVSAHEPSRFGVSYGSQRLSKRFVLLEETAKEVAMMSVKTDPKQLFEISGWIQDPEVIRVACAKDFEILRRMFREGYPIPSKVLEEAVVKKKDDERAMLLLVQIDPAYLAKASERLLGDKGFLTKCIVYYAIIHKNLALLEDPIYQTFRTKEFILEVFQQLRERIRLDVSKIEKLIQTLKPEFLGQKPLLALGEVQ